MGGKYRSRGRTKEQSNELRRASWTPEKRAKIAAMNSDRAALRRSLRASITEKQCGRCGELKSIESFCICRSSSDGRHSNCKSCEVIRVSEWAANNVDKVNKWLEENRPSVNRRQYEKRRTAILKQRRALRLENPEKFRARDREASKRNIVTIRAKSARRRASRQRATPSWLTAAQKMQIRQFYVVAREKEMRTDIKHHVDHIVPLRGSKVCGLHVPWNLQVLTEEDNCRKHNRFSEGVA